jgi:adenylyl-sulfate kinase
MTTGQVVWLTGLPSAGKTTLARAVGHRLRARGLPVELLDGDVVRRELWPELGFSRDARDTNVRRVGFIAELLARHGVVVIVALVSPYAAARAELRAKLSGFLEVFVDCPIEECVRRDVKGLYARARAGVARGVTGIDDPYEPPASPEVVVHTDREDVEQCVERIESQILAARGLGARP